MATKTASRSASRTPAARKTAAAKRANRRSAVNHTTSTAKKENTVPTVKTTRKTASAKKPDSIVLTFDRNDTEPKGNGGVRFNERGKVTVMRTAYIDQKTDKKLGSPKVITVTVAAA